MSIEGLKERARRHEQKEQWRQAPELYERAIEKLAEDEHPDIGLYNRVGDLYVRIGDLSKAVDHYEQAAQLYLEAELPNNAIAVCKKVIRYVPDRHSIYLRIGQIRAGQGFFTDARQNFLIYAERVQAEGDLEEALRALMEFADLSPGDVEIRMAVAQQLEQHERPQEAAEQLVAARSVLLSEAREDEAAALEDKILELDPEADLAAPAPARAGAAMDELPGFGDSGGLRAPEMGSVGEEEPEVEDFEITAGPAEVETRSEEEEREEDEGEPLPTFSHGEGDEEEAEALPTFGYDAEEGEEESEPLPTFGFEEEPEDETEPLPTFGFDEGEAEEEAEPLPTFGYDAEEADAEEVDDADEPEVLTAVAFGESARGDREVEEYVGEADEMPVMEVGLAELSLDDESVGDTSATAAADSASDEAREEALEEAASEARVERRDLDPAQLIEVGDIDEAERLLDDLIEREPDELSHRQRLVELAYRRGDPAGQAKAFLGLARCLERSGEAARAQGVYQQVILLDPENAEAKEFLSGTRVEMEPETASVASSEDYVDLGSLIFDEEEEEKTTRFKVAYEEPTGDESADFARMLSQFKEKVAENVDTDDVRAQHDLGTAYKEMGLIDEAIEQFQAALRAARDHLPTYELLGQCFLDKGQPEAAIKTLSRALELPFEIEDELLGIYYFIGRAYEAAGNPDSAVEFYDRVFSLDINFMDVTERLRSLR